MIEGREKRIEISTYNEITCYECNNIIAYIDWSLDTGDTANIICKNCYDTKIPEEQKKGILRVPRK